MTCSGHSFRTFIQSADRLDNWHSLLYTLCVLTAVSQGAPECKINELSTIEIDAPNNEKYLRPSCHRLRHQIPIDQHS